MGNNTEARIPPMTDPQSKHWQQPSPDRILIDAQHDVMDIKTFNALAEYSSSVPSGVYPGKMWKAVASDGRKFLRWFGIADDLRLCTCNQREILIAEAAHD